jgi:hypothetical protein
MIPLPDSLRDRRCDHCGAVLTDDGWARAIGTIGDKWTEVAACSDDCLKALLLRERRKAAGE